MPGDLQPCVRERSVKAARIILGEYNGEIREYAGKKGAADDLFRGGLRAGAENGAAPKHIVRESKRQRHGSARSVRTAEKRA